LSRVPQCSVEKLAGNGQTTWDGHFCTVQHNVIGHIKVRPDESEWNCGVKNNKVCPNIASEAIHAPHHWRVRKQHRLSGSDDLERLLCIEAFRIRVRTRKHSE
jgi:hypothetical protein